MPTVFQKLLKVFGKNYTHLNFTVTPWGTIIVPILEVMQLRAQKSFKTFLGWQKQVCSQLRVKIQAAESPSFEKF